MDYNFNNGYPFTWNSTSPFVPNRFSTNSSTTHPPPGFGAQVPSQSAVPPILPGFSGDVSIYSANRFPGATGFNPFGMNPQFSTTHSGPSTNFSSDQWSYGFLNRMPRFNVPVTHPQQLAVLTANSPLNNITIPVTTTISTVNDGIINVNPRGNGIPVDNVQLKIEGSTGNSDKWSSEEIADKSNDDISNQIALKVSSMLSNPSLLKNAISQINGNSSEGQNGDINVDSVKKSLKSPTKCEDDVLQTTNLSVTESATSVAEAQNELGTIR